MKKKKLFSAMIPIYFTLWFVTWYFYIFYYYQKNQFLFWTLSSLCFFTIILQFKRTKRLQKLLAHGFLEKVSYLSYLLVLWFFCLLSIYIPSLFFSIDLHPYIIGIPFIGLFYGYWNAKRNVFEKKIQVPLGKSGNSLKIIQISDLHLGLFIRELEVQKIKKQIEKQQPDLIVLTGDIFDSTPEEVGDFIKPLMDIKTKYPIYFVLGNHEYYWKAENWIRHLEDIGIKCLINSGEYLELDNGDKIWIAGVTDTKADKFIPSHKSSPSQANIGSEEAKFKILLSHRPELCDEVNDLDFDLMLSGHSHAGQFVPITWVVHFFNTYTKGLNKHKNLYVYVSEGTGFWGFPCRIGTRSELSIIEVGH